MSTHTPRSSKKSAIAARLITLAVALSIVFIIRSFFLGNYYVPSGSMENTLQVEDRILVSLMGSDNPQRGDVVVFEDRLNWMEMPPISGDHNVLVKRVIGVGGDVVSTDGAGNVLINGKSLDEPYVKGITAPFEEQTVPEGYVFVLGDNRENSADSRFHIDEGTQFIPTRNIVGKVWVRYWPLANFSTVD